jgi:hypothetical protein
MACLRSEVLGSDIGQAGHRVCEVRKRTDFEAPRVAKVGSPSRLPLKSLNGANHTVIAAVAAAAMWKASNRQPCKSDAGLSCRKCSTRSPHLLKTKLDVAHTIGTFKAGRTYRLELWRIAKQAAEQRNRLPNEYMRARSEDTQVEILIKARHGAQQRPGFTSVPGDDQGCGVASAAFASRRAASTWTHRNGAS